MGFGLSFGILVYFLLLDPNVFKFTRNGFDATCYDALAMGLPWSPGALHEFWFEQVET
jgi:hypothetical protein